MSHDSIAIGGKICLFALLLPTGRMHTEWITGTELVVYERKHCELQKFAYIVLVI